ncbi:hypothetical protein, partial [Pseudomonas viridiflava]|uniref:hypothetical protein n=1 Tax=Pseudomonas viridiflava TaxID=33069 RepID=UPI0013E0C2CF
MTLVKRVSEPPKLFGNYASLQWATVQALNGCLVNGADLLEQRYAEYRALIAKRETDPLAFKFLEFGMGSGEPIHPRVLRLRLAIPGAFIMTNSLEPRPRLTITQKLTRRYALSPSKRKGSSD